MNNSSSRDMFDSIREFCEGIPFPHVDYYREKPTWGQWVVAIILNLIGYTLLFLIVLVAVGAILSLVMWLLVYIYSSGFIFWLVQSAVSAASGQ